MRRTVLTIFTSLLFTITITIDAQLCYDAAGNSFTGDDVAYFLDQRFNCTIMLCHKGNPQVLKQLCPRELNETMLQGVRPVKPATDMPSVSCVPIHQCPEAVDQALIFCPLPSGQQGVVCSADSHITDFVPHEDYPKLQPETAELVARSALPPAARQFLTSVPEETADGHSETEAALQDAVQSASGEVIEAVEQAADDYVGKMENTTERLRATGQSSVSSVTRVFNLNFINSPDTQQIARQAVRLLSQSTLFLSKKSLSSEATTEPSAEATTQPTPRPSTKSITKSTTKPITKPTTKSTTKSTATSTAKPTSEPTDSPGLGPTAVTTEGPVKHTTTEGGQDPNTDPTPTPTQIQTLIPTPSPTPTAAEEVTEQPISAPQSCQDPEPPACDATATYRSADGSCNNLRHPRWGRRQTPLRRMFQNTYADGIFHPTSSSTLPNPRLVSEQLMGQENVPAQQRTLAVMTWGQFLDHDLVHTPIFQLDDGLGIECCPHRNAPPPSSPIHPQCLPISIREADAFYGPHLERCMNFVRSVPATRPGCELGPANQLNDITHWMDSSTVYGSTLDKQLSLRTLSGGLLRTSEGDLLPREEPVTSEDGIGTTTSCRGRVCFVAGDSRVNENPMLTMYHTLFVREHNRIAGKLQHYALNTSTQASDEDLFQRARRVVIAQWQHITYDEWLPALLGYKYSESVGLSKQYSESSSEYLDFLNPGVSNAFATAGFRLHSLIQDMLHFVSAASNTTTTIPLHDTFFEPSVLLTAGSAETNAETKAETNATGVRSGISQLARGITLQSPRVQDRHFSGQVRGQLFATDCVGLDLVTLNIQRGRDHGLAKYTTVLRWCTGVRVSGWSDLAVVMTSESVTRLKSVYADWSEVDLYTGLNMERLVPGAMLGPTARCLITEQFVRLRYGDRFFYDLGGQPGSFTKDQLTQLRRASWARLLCDNVGDDFSAIQPLAFFQPHDVFNPVTDCHLLPEVDLSRF